MGAAVKLTDQTGAALRGIAERAHGSANPMASVREAMAAMRRATDQLAQAVAEAGANAQQNQQAAESMGQPNNQMVSSLDVVSAVVEENTAFTGEMSAGSAEVAQAIESIVRMAGVLE